jgi:Amt family ammonium transporter
LASQAKNDLVSGVDSFYLLFAGALVFFMQVGFAMLLAGSIREKNVANVLLWNLLDSAGGAFAFWTVGYAFAYGGDDLTKPKSFVGTTGFFLATPGVDFHFWCVSRCSRGPICYCGPIWMFRPVLTLFHPFAHYRRRFFQFAFACAVSSITAGAIAERTKMAGYLFFSIFLIGFVYPVCAHTYWSYNGFLSTFAAEPLWGQGVIDFAGSGPVHMCGGTAALIMCKIIGPRTGRFYDSAGNLRDEPKAMGPHSVTLMVSTNCVVISWPMTRILSLYHTNVIPSD